MITPPIHNILLKFNPKIYQHLFDDVHDYPNDQKITQKKRRHSSQKRGEGARCWLVQRFHWPPALFYFSFVFGGFWGVGKLVCFLCAVASPPLFGLPPSWFNGGDKVV